MDLDGPFSCACGTLIPTMVSMVWLDKLVLIDRERVVAHLREQWDSLNRTRRLYAKLRLREMQDMPLE